ncbi:YchJ family protein [Streptomyces sp. NPDC092296]|uniref:YchJ family protein n=1 Tax=Streptomyces sp. NPDC092296 TaxID=3366012 RepID=UPI0038169549
MSRRTPRPQPTPATPAACPCGLPAAYDDCCGRLHRGEVRAATPEQLMRSRYSAFAVRDEGYLLRSWHPTTRPPALGLDPALRWLRLEVLDCTGGGPFHHEGTVDFRAHYREHGRAGALREHSRFVRHEGGWLYVDGDTSD